MTPYYALLYTLAAVVALVVIGAVVLFLAGVRITVGKTVTRKTG